MKTNALKRLHIKIKGKDHEEASKRHVAKMAKTLNLKGYTQHETGIVEVVAEGKKERLWELVKSCTGIKVKTQIKEIIFYFKDWEGNFTSFILI